MFSDVTLVLLSYLADGAQDLQRRLTRLDDGQDGLIVGQTHPGGSQEIRNPNFAVCILLRKTFHRAFSLLLKIEESIVEIFSQSHDVIALICHYFSNV